MIPHDKRSAGQQLAVECLGYMLSVTVLAGAGPTTPAAEMFHAAPQPGLSDLSLPEPDEVTVVKDLTASAAASGGGTAAYVQGALAVGVAINAEATVTPGSQARARAARSATSHRSPRKASAGHPPRRGWRPRR